SARRPAPDARESRAREPELKPFPAKVERKPTEQPKPVQKTKKGGGRKADIFTERVTLRISPEMRDDVERIARELQRAKTSKLERITANTVMRVAIKTITKRFELKTGQAPNNEEELFNFVEGVLNQRGS